MRLSGDALVAVALVAAVDQAGPVGRGAVGDTLECRGGRGVGSEVTRG